MRIPRLLRAFLVRGVFWRKFLNWAVNNVPLFFEPFAMAFWSLFFLAAAVPARRAVMRNLRLIFPGSGTLRNLARNYRVFWNFAWTIADTARFSESRTMVDWEFDGYSSFSKLARNEGGSIILTAHMGNYDLGAYLFAERMNRKLVIIRAPEPDQDTHAYESESRGRVASKSFTVDYGAGRSELAFDLIDALRAGNVVAIQGDRVLPDIASSPVELFGEQSAIPTGPFALAMATHTPIFPLFVIRMGRRRYRVVTGEAIKCVRTSRDRDRDLERAIMQWRDLLQSVIREYWYQWYMFHPISREAP